MDNGLNMEKVNEGLEITGNYISSTLSDIYSFFNESAESYNEKDLKESIDACIEDLEGLKTYIHNYALHAKGEQDEK